jgi:hypothetical protein
MTKKTEPEELPLWGGSFFALWPVSDRIRMWNLLPAISFCLKLSLAANGGPDCFSGGCIPYKRPVDMGITKTPKGDSNHGKEKHQCPHPQHHNPRI